MHDDYKIDVDLERGMRRILRVAIVIGVTVIALAAIAVFLLSRSPVVSADYVDDQAAGGSIEATYMAMGPYAVSSEVYDAEPEDGEERQYKVWHPVAEGSYPLVIMVNGTGVPFQRYEAIFEHLASWGFVVVGNDYETSWDGVATSKTLDFARSESDVSIWVDWAHVAVGGHSQGGEGTFNALADTIGSVECDCAFALSPTSNPLAVALGWSHQAGTEFEYGYDPTAVKAPMLLVAGTGSFDSETVSPLEEMASTFDSLGSEHAVMARLTNVDHGDVLWRSDGYVAAWLRYWLHGDETAGAAFYGDAPEIENNDRWQDVRVR